VTPGATLDEVVGNLKEAIELHFDGENPAQIVYVDNLNLIVTLKSQKKGVTLSDEKGFESFIKEYTREKGELFHPEISKNAVKPGRNDPCPCGSGKKYKNCCGAE
jgi:uncharacterized protein YchJ